mmetsp:Transcript_17116/g.51223  ORF Transcript_17116/g.51223 Transcript_17116/m.51223 type:complete len:244 (+) Transcript_17116:1481-2212(+)
MFSELLSSTQRCHRREPPWARSCHTNSGVIFSCTLSTDLVMGCSWASRARRGKASTRARMLCPAAGWRSRAPISPALMSCSWSSSTPRSSSFASSSGASELPNWRSGCWWLHSRSSKALQRRSASSAVALHPRRRQISNTERAMRGALADTYIMSAVSEKLSMRALDTKAWMRTQTLPCLDSGPPRASKGQASPSSRSSSGSSSSLTAMFSNSLDCAIMLSIRASSMCLVSCSLKVTMEAWRM